MIYRYDLLAREIESEPGFYPMCSEPEVGETLRALIKLTSAKNITELGTYKGYTTLRLMEAAEATGGWVTSIDIEDFRSSVITRIDMAEFYTFRLGDSVEVVQTLDSIDFAFIDTTHTYPDTMNEVLAISDKMKAGGIIALHDPLSFPGVGQAVAKFINMGLFHGLTFPTPPRKSCPEWQTVSGLAVLVKV